MPDRRLDSVPCTCQVIGLPGGGFAVASTDYSADAGRTDAERDGGRGVLVVSGAPSRYRAPPDGDGFILKGPDGRDSLTSIEVIRFDGGQVLELDRLYADGIPAGLGADGVIPDHLLSPPSHDEPLVSPALPDKTGAGDAFVLPALPDDQPLVLPGAGETTPLFLDLEARLALSGDGMVALDGVAGEPAHRDGDWMF